MGGEIARFKAALRAASRELKAIKAQIPSDTRAEIAAFIDTHLLMLEDTALTTGTLQAIRERRCNAEHALKLQRDAIVSVFDAIDDAYLRTRRDDVDHVVNRVQRILSGGRTPVFVSRPDDPQVVFADDLAPADTVLMQDQGVAAFLTEYGGPLSHTAILARSLGVPAVVGLHDARAHLRDDTLVIVDGRQGVVVVAPDPATLRHYRSRRKEIMRIRAARGAMRKTPAVTCDGEPVTLQANVEFHSELALAIRDGAAGVGLYRTEYLFLNRSSPPTEAEQHEAYSGIVRAAKGGPVTIRTLDLGADKQVDGVRPGRSGVAEPGARPARSAPLPQGARPLQAAAARNSQGVRPWAGEDDDPDDLQYRRVRAGPRCSAPLQAGAQRGRSPLRSRNPPRGNDRGPRRRNLRRPLRTGRWTSSPSGPTT